MRALLCAGALAQGCVGASAQPSPGPNAGAVSTTTALIPPVPSGLAPAPALAPAPKQEREPPPKGAALLSIHVERGKRQPLALIGGVSALAASVREGLEGWTEVTLSTASGAERFYLLLEPPTLKLPFAMGDRISVDVDCKKGGWRRVCDGSVRDMTKKKVLVISGSGSDEVAREWSLRRGAVATSEVHPGTPPSIQHTHALELESEGAAVTAMPYEWKRVLVHGRSYLVTGYEVVWEGTRPPDARDHRTFSIVLER